MHDLTSFGWCFHYHSAFSCLFFIVCHHYPPLFDTVCRKFYLVTDTVCDNACEPGSASADMIVPVTTSKVQTINSASNLFISDLPLPCSILTLGLAGLLANTIPQP